MKKIFLILLFIAFTVLSVLLILENSSRVMFNFYFIERETELYMVIAAAFLVGLLMGILLMSLSVMRNKLHLGKAKRKLNKVEKEVQNLRAAPITEPMKDEQ